MGIYPELNDLTVEELLDCFHSPPIEGWRYAASYYLEVTLQIRRREGSTHSSLWQELSTKSATRKRAIIFALSFPEQQYNEIYALSLDDQKRLRETLHRSLNDRWMSVVAEAIDGLTSAGDLSVKKEVLSKINHANPYVRGAVLRYMSRLFPKLAPPLLISALDDRYYVVRENAVDEIDDLGLTDLLPQVKPLLNDPHPDVRQAAQTAIQNLEEPLEES